jgi:hypothetical protein
MQQPTAQRKVSPISMALMVVAFVVIMGYCGWSIAGRAASPAAPNERQISRESMGDAWPFTVDSGTLRCLNASDVVFVVDGKTYAVNGTAKARYPEVNPLWRDDPAYPDLDLKVNIGPVSVISPGS